MHCSLFVHLSILLGSFLGGGWSAMLGSRVAQSICMQHSRFSTWGSSGFGILQGPLKAPLTPRKYDDCPWITWNTQCRGSRDRIGQKCPIFIKDSCHHENSNQRSQPSARIVGGTEVVPHSYPSFVRFYDRLFPEMSNCGGTIINRNWVITAEHCKTFSRSYGILAGRHYGNVSEEGEQIILVDKRVRHPDQPGFDGSPAAVDLALLHLARPLEFSDKIQPVTLPTRDYAKLRKTETEEEVTLTLVGGGIDDRNKSSNGIRQVKVSLQSLDKCRELAGPEEKIQEWELCETGEHEIRGSCSGDSGGPAYDIDESSGSQILAGVISFGIGKCTEPGKISGQISVFPFLQWIEDNVKDD